MENSSLKNNEFWPSLIFNKSHKYWTKIQTNRNSQNPLSLNNKPDQLSKTPKNKSKGGNSKMMKKSDDNMGQKIDKAFQKDLVSDQLIVKVKNNITPFYPSTLE